MDRHLVRLRKSFSLKASDFDLGPDDPQYKILKEFHNDQMAQLFDMPSLHPRDKGMPSDTYLHANRVANDVFLFASFIGLPDNVCKNFRWAVQLHDIGKLDVPVEILDKPGRLTDEEFAEMKRHTKYGVDRIKDSGIKHPILDLAAEIAHDHHERIDGKGYYGLKGKEVASRVRLVQLCDIYDAVSAPRTYRTEKEQLTPYTTMKNILDPHGFLHHGIDMAFARPFCLLKLNLMDGDLTRDEHLELSDYLLHPENYHEDDYAPPADYFRGID